MASFMLAADEWEHEYHRLVCLCTALTGRSEVAEDLAQETLYEAWRHRERLYDATGQAKWLAAIARNICRRWRAHQFQEQAHQLGDIDSIGMEPADHFDLQAMLEQAELASLVEQALALLPSVTRTALVAHIIDGQSYAAIAQRLGMAAGVVRVQVHRGKARLRYLFATTLREEAQACGLAGTHLGAWTTSPLWCPLCGAHHLQARWYPAQGELSLQCPSCAPTTGLYCSYTSPDLFAGVSSLKAAYNRVQRWVNIAYRPGKAQVTQCLCGRVAVLHPYMPVCKPSIYADMPQALYQRIQGMHLYCAPCDSAATMRLSNFALYLPDAWRFWRQHPRIHTRPERQVEYSGQPALAIRFESMTGAAYFDVILDQATLAVIAYQSNVLRLGEDVSAC